jgi:hypothetical protein
MSPKNAGILSFIKILTEGSSGPQWRGLGLGLIQ